MHVRELVRRFAVEMIETARTKPESMTPIERVEVVERATRLFEQAQEPGGGGTGRPVITFNVDTKASEADFRKLLASFLAEQAREAGAQPEAATPGVKGTPRAPVPTDCGEAIAYVNDHFQGEYTPGEKPAKVLVRLLEELRRQRSRGPVNVAGMPVAGRALLAEVERMSADVAAMRGRCAAAVQEVGDRGWSSNPDGFRGFVATAVNAVRALPLK